MKRTLIWIFGFVFGIFLNNSFPNAVYGQGVGAVIESGAIYDKNSSYKDTFYMNLTNCADLADGVSDLSAKIVEIRVGPKVMNIPGSEFKLLGNYYMYYKPGKKAGEELDKITLNPLSNSIYLYCANTLVDGIANPITVMVKIGEWECGTKGRWTEEKWSGGVKYILPIVQISDNLVVFSEGNYIREVSQTIGQAGGTVTSSDPTSPIYGIIVQFPGGALPQNTEVTLGYNDGSLIPNSGVYAGVNLLIEVPGVSTFGQPVTIIVPFDNPNAVAIPYYITQDGHLRPAQLVNIDSIAKTFSFQTFHASLFSWIIELTNNIINSDFVDTGFKPEEDGFKVVNNGSIYNRGGECFGMTSFALWYFMNHMGTAGNFYPRFYDLLGQDSSGAALRGQDVIATRSFVSIAQQWNTYFPTVAREINLSQQGRYATIRNIIDNTLNPVLVYLYHSTGVGGAHSVLAYAYHGSSGQINIYDPNYPGTTKIIQYNSASNSFQNYSGYDGIVYNGDGSLNLTEPYLNILNDAESNFRNSAMPIINVTSHPNGSIVTSNTIVLSGTIESVEILVDRLKVHVGSVEFSTSVPPDGNFSIPVSLENGVNHLAFSLEGKDSDGKDISISPTNLDTVDYIIELTGLNAVILMTLTWDKDDTDLDTYVIDPNGDYSSYYHMNTADGGELDYDDVDGFGPEHWTLMNTDIIRYDQPYRFRVHYYSDHGNGGTNYLVTIKLYEGTEREASYSYTGFLMANDSSNSGPLDVGPDWVDIAQITLTQDASASGGSLCLTPMADASASTSGQPIITVPIPSVEERIRIKNSQ